MEKIEIIKLITKLKDRQRKYYLHYKARKAGIRIEPLQKTIFIPIAKKKELTNNDYVIALENEYNYNIQLTIV